MTTAILLAGGIGSRVNHDIAKQHIVIKDHQIIEYTLMAFSRCESIDTIVIVSNPKYMNVVNQMKAKFPKLRCVVPGGQTRIMSVYNAIKAIVNDTNEDDKIIISDAARPCITTREIQEMIKKLDKYLVVTTGVTCNETILKIENNALVNVIPKEGIIRQTSPEGYVFSILKWLYIDTPVHIISSYKNIGVDQLFASGIDVGIVKSSPLNFKITTKEDLQLFESVLKDGFEKIICG